MNSGTKWRDLIIAAAVASVLELTPAADAFYRYIYLPAFHEPADGALLEILKGVGWCFYLLIFWLGLQFISFLFGNPSKA